MQKHISLALIVIVIVGAIWYLESGKVDRGGGDAGDADLMLSDTSMTVEEKAKQYEVAKEISTPDAFINVDSISIQEEIDKGNVVLIDFWTYSCINCQRTLPFLNDWHDKYADDGLVIIGMHTPEFEFEKDLANVQDAVERFEVQHPVVLDNDFSTWRSYNNRYWPRKYLIDIDGFIVYDHIGEGAYDETEAKIVELLNEKKQRDGEVAAVTLEESVLEGVDVVDSSQQRSHETYLGYGRSEYLYNYPGEDQECVGAVCAYERPETLPLGAYALVGDWLFDEENTVLSDESGSIVIHFTGSKVHLVGEGTNGPVIANILLDGEPIDADRAGRHVVDGQVTFDAAQLYTLVDLRGTYEEHTLEIKFVEEGFAGFAFTFG